ncbi:MAG TPA: alkaline phosphatase family protein, partial [Acidimicrobiia bacterium]
DRARPLLASNRATLEAPFPTTTSVSLATIATALPPSQHGLIAHLAWLEEIGRVVNTLKWVDLAGRPVTYDYGAVLPRPNLWERLRRAGVEPITVQPASFTGTPLSRLLYRGARFEAAWDDGDLVEATVRLASEPGRFIFTYVWQVDFAGHVSGLDSPEFDAALGLAADTWDRLASRIPPDVTLLGTADHGLIEYDEEDKILVREEPFASLRYAGDPRGVHVWGDDDVIRELGIMTEGLLVDPLTLLGPDPVAEARARSGDSLLLSPPGKVILPPGFDKRLRAYHGGLEPAELEIPLLVA